MDALTTVLGKRTRTMGDAMDTSMAVGGYTEKRPRCQALEIALVADSEVVESGARAAG